MKNIKKIILLVLGVGFFGCKDYVEGTNDNPNDFTSVPADLLMGQAELEVAFVSESQPARYAGIFTDQFTGSDRQFVSYNNYTVTAGDFNDPWQHLYRGMSLAQIVIANTTSPLVKGRAQMCKAILAGEVAALFGAVPYKEALQPDKFPNPAYDSQKSVLNDVIGLLDSAIANVGGSAIRGDVFAKNNTELAKVAIRSKPVII